MIIFGGAGDLSARKLLPALYMAHLHGNLPASTRIIAIGRKDWTRDEYLEFVQKQSRPFVDSAALEGNAWQSFLATFDYVKLDVSKAEDYARLAEITRPDVRRVFYLATSPALFTSICDSLAGAGLVDSLSRVVLEKPLGHDLASAQEINVAVGRHFEEKQIYRIDHYLGKETVQNLMYFRFANAIYEPLWNRRYIDHVQITVAEQVGVEGRGGYYDHAGASRDMLQNHLFQLFTLTAMEPPASLDAESIRDEKVKVLRSIATPSIEFLQKNVVRAQYGGGYINNKAIPSYRQEEKVAHNSLTETFVAARFEIDNWRWSGVPFYLRTGKALAMQFTEINIIFKRPPSVLFAASGDDRLRRNSLRIRIQPNEGISLNFNAKVPGKAEAELVDMDFLYKSGFDHYLPEAYERLIVDSLIGESTLFTRSDEVEQAWRLVDSLRSMWDKQASRDLPLYACGSMGPVEADILLEKDGRHWVQPKELAT